jgi:hypothetical protein
MVTVEQFENVKTGRWEMSRATTSTSTSIGNPGTELSVLKSGIAG